MAGPAIGDLPCLAEQDARKVLGLDEGYFHPPVHGRIPLPVPVQVLEEDEHMQILVDTDGIKKKILKETMSMPIVHVLSSEKPPGLGGNEGEPKLVFQSPRA